MTWRRTSHTHLFLLFFLLEQLVDRNAIVISSISFAHFSLRVCVQCAACVDAEELSEGHDVHDGASVVWRRAGHGGGRQVEAAPQDDAFWVSAAKHSPLSLYLSLSSLLSLSLSLFYLLSLFSLSLSLSASLSSLFSLSIPRSPSLSLSLSFPHRRFRCVLLCHFVVCFSVRSVHRACRFTPLQLRAFLGPFAKHSLLLVEALRRGIATAKQRAAPVTFPFCLILS